jgi:peptide/nickel transport system permease protein
MAANSSKNTVGKKARSKLVDLIFRMVREKPLGTFGGVITLALLLAGIFASVIAPYDPNAIHAANALQPPSFQFWFGNDILGQDLLSRVIYGARISVIIGLGASTLATLVETTIGLSTGYIGGTFDLIVQRFVDAVMCFPGLILMMVIMSIVSGSSGGASEASSILRVVLVLGITWGITGSRLIRGATMSIKQNMYVQAAIASGASTSSIIIRHILPNIMAPVIIQFTTRVPAIILTEAQLSFLGYGIPPPNPSWGGMLSGSARTYMYQSPWIIIWPGLALGIVVYGVNIFGDALRDLLDPRLRGGIGRYGIKVKKRPKVQIDSDAIARD